MAPMPPMSTAGESSTTSSIQCEKALPQNKPDERSSQNHAVNFYAKKKFVPNSKLKEYLMQKRLGHQFHYTTLHEVLQTLKEIISNEKLYDASNASIVICDEKLEEALNVKALHLSEIREHVSQQLVDVEPSSSEFQDGIFGGVPRGSTLPGSSGAYNLNPLGGYRQPGLVLNTEKSCSGGNLTPPRISPPVSTPSETPRPPIPTPTQIGDPLGEITSQCRFTVKPEFRKVLAEIETVRSDQTVFEYDELTSYLSTYILNKKEKFFDNRNIKVALVKGDQLGKAFGVNAFHRSQVTSLLRAQLTRLNPNSEAKLENKLVQKEIEPMESPKNLHIRLQTCQSSSQPALSSDTTNQISAAIETLRGRKRTNDVGGSNQLVGKDKNSMSTDHSYSIVVASSSKRFRSSSQSFTVDISFNQRNENDSSDESNELSETETIYSAQGYETVALANVTSSEEDFDSDQNSGSDSEVAEERNDDDHDYYDGEYEPDSDAERNQEPDREPSSSEDSDYQDLVIASSMAVLLDDSDCMADSESDFELSNYDPEVGAKGSEVWRCCQCNTPNQMRVRFCDHCWQERKHWLPERPKPHKKNKNKQTNGQKIKGAARALNREGGESSRSQSPSEHVKGDDEESAEPPNLQRMNSQCSSQPDSGIHSGSSQTLSDYSSQDFDEEQETQISKPEGDLVSRIDSDKVLTRISKVEKQKPDLLCSFCLTRERNAGIVHGGIIHQVSCYPCAKKIYKRRQPCPICRRRIEKIAKIVSC